MAPVPSLALLRFLRSGLQQSSGNACRACVPRDATRLPERALSNFCRNTRAASTYRSPTAISAAKHVPAKLRRLHDALGKVKADASGYADLSRLELALRGLETPTPTIRVAFLGLNSFTSIRQFARLVLADPLTPVADWEQELGSLQWWDNRSLLLRYGDVADRISSNAILDVHHVPAEALRAYNIEILLSTIPTSDATSVGGVGLEETALVPVVGTPMSFSGNMSLIRHPVHRAIVLADGIPGSIDLGAWRAANGANRASTSQVQTALNLRNYTANEMEAEQPLTATVIDLEQAIDSLALLRESKENASKYAEGWQKSGLPELTDWFVAASQKHPSTLPVAIHWLVRDIISKSGSLLRAERAKQTMNTNTSAITGTTNPLAEALTRWATKGHVELRDRLDGAVMSKNWAKLQWWKLLWRADDVGMLSSQMVERTWLPSTEKGLIWLQGRFYEAGLEESRDAADSSDASHGDAELGEHIHEIRRRLLRQDVPELEALAQALVMQTASLTTLSSAFGALVYFAWSTMTAVQAGAFAALGLTWSLRRMQRKWEEAREAWLETLREEGRKSLSKTEEELQARLAQGPMPRPGQELAVQDLDAANAAVEEARDALQQLELQ